MRLLKGAFGVPTKESSGAHLSRRIVCTASSVLNGTNRSALSEAEMGKAQLNHLGIGGQYMRIVSVYCLIERAHPISCVGSIDCTACCSSPIIVRHSYAGRSRYPVE